MDKPITVIAGLGRCGLTMVAQMIAEGGHVVAGDPPAYEPDFHEINWTDADAVKLVDPIGNEYSGDLPEPGRLQWIWMSRDAKEQARSMAKLLRSQGKKVEPRALQKQIRPETRQHWQWIERRGETLYKHRFEHAFWRPWDFTHSIAANLPWQINLKRMRDVLEERDPECADDLSRELSMIR